MMEASCAAQIRKGILLGRAEAFYMQEFGAAFPIPFIPQTLLEAQAFSRTVIREGQRFAEDTKKMLEEVLAEEFPDGVPPEYVSQIDQTLAHLRDSEARVLLVGERIANAKRLEELL